MGPVAGIVPAVTGGFLVGPDLGAAAADAAPDPDGQEPPALGQLRRDPGQRLQRSGDRPQRHVGGRPLRRVTSEASNLTPHDTNGARDAFLRDRKTGDTMRESWTSRERQADLGSGDTAVVSDDGRFVAFTSESANLAPRERNGWQDVFIRDRKRGLTGRVSLNSREVPANRESELSSISAGGRYVLFTSPATNLVVHDVNESPEVFSRDLHLRRR